MRKNLRLLIPVLVCLISGSGRSAESVYVVGLFVDRAVVVIDGKRHILSVGGKGRSGVRLLAANSEIAVLDVDGVAGTYTAESRVQAPLRKRRQPETQIWRDRSGLFQATGSINGRLFSLLVDTGATQVAMNENHARRLGIDFRVVGTPVRVATASGEENVYRVNLDSVQIGELKLNNIGAIVLPGQFPDKILLGMSFLKRVEMQNKGDRLVLRKKF